MAKLEIRDVYRFIPIHPEERPFLALSWEGHVYIDCQLPFSPSLLSLHLPYMRVLLCGIWRVQAQRTPARVRLPITASLMWQIKAHLALPSPSFLKVFIWTACSVGSVVSFVLASSSFLMVLMAGGCHGAHAQVT